LAAARAADIGWQTAGFAGGLLSDAMAGRRFEGPHAAQRASALTTLLAELGPTFIKIGQSASVRVDLLPPSYIEALTALQEDVPAFPTSTARDIIAGSLPADVAQRLLAGLSAEPLAAASLGQVPHFT
jgi:predicted unusual protein kinase regulating ubiquinone biosynthesis (AarF/ABC1/UbiB family)